MKILIFGASGATGYHLVSQALSRGYLVSAFVRDPSRLKILHENVEFLQGDVADYSAVEAGIKNQDAVLSALGASSPLKRDYSLIKGIENIVAAMEAQKVKRLIYQSFLGVKENRSDFGFLMNVIFPVLLRYPIMDHELKEQIIEKSDLDWTIVRCPKLTDGPSRLNYSHGVRITSNSILPLISRADIAHFMINEIEDRKYVRMKPRVISN
ncbi:MAG TPA: SDR family oxidoreductase [Chryseosolibacter sp.]